MATAREQSVLYSSAMEGKNLQKIEEGTEKERLQHSSVCFSKGKGFAEEDFSDQIDEIREVLKELIYQISGKVIRFKMRQHFLT